MLSEELKSIHAGLGKLLGKLDPESADYAATEDAENLENSFVPKETA